MYLLYLCTNSSRAEFDWQCGGARTLLVTGFRVQCVLKVEAVDMGSSYDKESSTSTPLENRWSLDTRSLGHQRTGSLD